MDTISTKEHNLEHKEDKMYASHPHAKRGTEKFINANDKPRVLFAQLDQGGCGWYRGRQFANELNKQGLAYAMILDGKEDEDMLDSYVKSADVIITRFNTGQNAEIFREGYGKKVVLDHDDNTFEILPSNEHYKDFGVEDVWVPVEGEEEPRPLWVTGITPGFSWYKNLKNMYEIEYGFKTASMVTSPTKHLSEVWANLNDNVAVIPNCIDFDLYNPMIETKDRSKKGKIRIGWQGGVSHFGDIASISEPLRRILKDNESCYYYSVGSYSEAHFRGVEDKVSAIPWVPFVAHPYRMRELDLDIGIIPLEDYEFNRCKSEVKFSEYAALGIPALVADMKPYVVKDEDDNDLICENEVNCLTYRTPKEFGIQLQRLIDDEGLRNKLAKNAKKWVKEHRDLSKLIVPILEAWLE